MLLTSLIALPLFIRAEKKAISNNAAQRETSIELAMSTLLENMESDVIMLNEDGKIAWTTKKFQDRIGLEKLPRYPSEINEAFKLATSNPGESFNYEIGDEIFSVHFDKNKNVYFQENVTTNVSIKEDSINHKTVIGIICLNFFNKEDIGMQAQQFKNEFEKIILQWSRKNKILSSGTGDFSYLLHIRMQDYSKIYNENFAIYKDIEKLLKTYSIQATCLLSFALDINNPIEAGEKAREGIIELSTNKKSSLSIKTPSSTKHVVLDKTPLKQTGVSPEEFVTKKENNYSGNSNGINFSNVEAEHDRVLKEVLIEKENSNLENMTHTNKNFVKTSNNVDNPPDWLKSIINENIDKPNLNSSKTTTFEGTLLGEMEQSERIFCYFSNLNEKPQLLLALVLGLISHYMNKDCYFYSEKKFQVHHTLKKKLDEVELQKLHENIVDAFSFKRINKHKAQYIIVNSKVQNNDLINTILPHKIAYLNREGTTLLKLFLSSIKHVANEITIDREIQKAFINIAKKEASNGGNEVINFLESLTIKNKEPIEKIKKEEKKVIKEEVKVVPKIEEEVVTDPNQVFLKRFSIPAKNVNDLQFSLYGVKKELYENVKEVKGLKFPEKILVSFVSKERSSTQLEIDEVAQEFIAIKEVGLLIIFTTLFNNKNIGMVFSNSDKWHSFDLIKNFQNPIGNKRRATFELKDLSSNIPEEELKKVLLKL